MKVRGVWRGPKVELNNVNLLSERIDPNIIGKGPVVLDIGTFEYELEISVEEMVQQVKNVKDLWRFAKEEVIPDVMEMLNTKTVDITPEPTSGGTD